MTVNTILRTDDLALLSLMTVTVSILRTDENSLIAHDCYCKHEHAVL